jgi:hypothetical protein
MKTVLKSGSSSSAMGSHIDRCRESAHTMIDDTIRHFMS